MKKFDLAKEYYTEATAVETNYPEPYYSVAVIDWTQTYVPRQEERAKLGMKPDEALPAKDKKVCATMKERNTANVQEGIDNLNKAIQLRPDYDDAMAYLNLMYRERADIQCDDPASRAADYSDVDRAALHVRKSDEAYFIGPAPAAESYLRTDKILGVAKRSGAEAIHPGYGFLSENATFAQACADAGVKFIGPTPHSMEMMGSKTRARQEMEKAGGPGVPGTSRGLVSPDEGEELAPRTPHPLPLTAA